MNLLALDTTNARCAALARRADAASGAADVIVSDDLVRGHDARLAGMARDALAGAGLKPVDLDRIVVATGPGSFTGVRVGVAFARGLAAALAIPAVGVSGLDALARTIRNSGMDSGAPAERLFAVHDARRGEVVWRGYLDGEGLGPARRDPVADAARAIDAHRAGAPCVLAGSGASLLAGPGRAEANVAVFAMSALADLGAAADPAESPAAPFYYRPPDAKLPQSKKAGGRDPFAETA